MKKWENVVQGISILIILTFLSPYLEKIGISFWLRYLCILAAIFCVFFILSKQIKFLQKPVTNKVGWLSFTAAAIIIMILAEFILK